MDTYRFSYARDGDLVEGEVQALDKQQGEALAVERVNAELRTSYKSWEAACADGDGSTLEVDQRLTAYRQLADGLSDMVEEGRLTEGHIPDDYQWLAAKLALIAGLDAGPVYGARG